MKSTESSSPRRQHRVGGAIVMVLAVAACTTVNVDPVPGNGGSGALPVAGSGGSSGSGGTGGSSGGGAGGSAGSTSSRAGSGGTGSGSTGGSSPIVSNGAQGGTGNDGNDGDAGTELGDGAAATANLVSNPGFELGLTSWTAKFGGTLARTTDEAYAGQYSAKLSGRTANYQGVFYNLTGLVTSGGSYAAAAHAYTTDGTATTANLKLTALLNCVGEVESRYVTIRSLTSTPTAWSELSGNLVIPASEACSLVEAFLYVEGPPANFELYVDEVSLIAN